MAAFAQFGSDLDKATQQQLARGERLVEMLKQGQYVPMPVEEQVVVIYAGTNGFVDDYPVAVLGRYETELLVVHEGAQARALLDELKSNEQARGRHREAAARRAHRVREAVLVGAKK